MVTVKRMDFASLFRKAFRSPHPCGIWSMNSRFVHSSTPLHGLLYIIALAVVFLSTYLLLEFITWFQHSSALHLDIYHSHNVNCSIYQPIHWLGHSSLSLWCLYVRPTQRLKFHSLRMETWNVGRAKASYCSTHAWRFAKVTLHLEPIAHFHYPGITSITLVHTSSILGSHLSRSLSAHFIYPVITYDVSALFHNPGIKFSVHSTILG
jgi:hypothetical protein